MAQRIDDLVQVALAVLRRRGRVVGGAVDVGGAGGHIGTRAAAGRYQTIGGVGPVGGPSRASRRRAEALAAVTVRGRRFAVAGQIAVAVVAVRFQLGRRGDPQGQVPDLVPLGGGGAGIGRASTVHPLDLTLIAIVGMGGDGAVVVGFLGQVVVGVVAAALAGAAAQAAGRADRGRQQHAILFQEAVDAGLAGRVSDSSLVVVAVLKLVRIGTARQRAAGGPTLGIVRIGSVAAAVFIHDPRQGGGETAVFVDILAYGAIWPRDRRQHAGAVVAVAGNRAIGRGHARHAVLAVVGEAQAAPAGGRDCRQLIRGVVGERRGAAIALANGLQLAAGVVGLHRSRIDHRVLPAGRLAVGIGDGTQRILGTGSSPCHTTLAETIHRAIISQDGDRSIGVSHHARIQAALPVGRPLRRPAASPIDAVGLVSERHR